MSQTVIGLFNRISEAREAESQLLSSGFDRGSIDLSPQTSSDVTGEYRRDIDDDGSTERSAGDKVKHFFRELFGKDDEAERYAGVADRSEAVVTVHAETGEEARRAAMILDDAGAVDVDQQAAEYGLAGGSGTYSSYADTYAQGDTGMRSADLRSDDMRARAGDQSVDVIEEDLAVGKRTVETGGVRIRSRIVEKPIEESIRLREERVRVQRTPVNRPANPADLQAFREGEIEVVEHAEVPVVEKQARVVEEVSVSREEAERTETIQDTVRRTEVDVEDLPANERSGLRSGSRPDLRSGSRPDLNRR